MNAITQVENQLGLSLKDYDVDQAMWSALTSSIFPGAKPESIVMAVEYAKARKLDIMKKPCHIVPMFVKDSKTGQESWRDIIMPSITEHRITASRSNSYAGIDSPVFGPMVSAQFGNATHTIPEFCTVTVYRIIHGEKVAFSHTEYFEEACSTIKSGDLNSMWKKRKRGQLAKCAEAGALRKAFPEEIGSEYTLEEMQGKEITVGGEVAQDEVKKIEETRPTLTEKQANTAIKKMKNGEVELQQIVDYYVISDELLNFIKAQTEVLEHDPV